jgi:hypothetical protein
MREILSLGVGRRQVADQLSRYGDLGRAAVAAGRAVVPKPG